MSFMFFAIIKIGMMKDVKSPIMGLLTQCGLCIHYFLRLFLLKSASFVVKWFINFVEFTKVEVDRHSGSKVNCSLGQKGDFIYADAALTSKKSRLAWCVYSFSKKEHISSACSKRACFLVFIMPIYLSVLHSRTQKIFQWFRFIWFLQKLLACNCNWWNISKIILTISKSLMNLEDLLHASFTNFVHLLPANYYHQQIGLYWILYILRLACSVHPNLGNRHFIHVSIELQLKGSNQNPNLSNRHFMSQLNYNWRAAIVTAEELNQSLRKGWKSSDTGVSLTAQISKNLLGLEKQRH